MALSLPWLPRRLGLAEWAFAALVALLLAFAPAFARLAAAQETDEDIEANATIRVVHASPGAPDVDVLVDGQLLAQGIPFGGVTDYVPLAPGDYQVQIVPTGETAEAAVIDQAVTAEPAAAYILVALGSLAEIESRLYQVNLDDIEPGIARARLINAATNEAGIDLSVTGGDTLFTDVGFGDAADYADVAPGTYSFDVRGVEDRVLATVPDITIEETRVYDIVALPESAAGGATLLPLVTSVSPPCDEVLGIEGSSTDACLRLVHAAPDSAAVDVYVNDSLLAQNLEFGAATAYVPVPSGGGRVVQVAPTGSPVEEAFLTADLGFDPGQAYTALVTGGQDDLQLMISGTDLRPIPENQARFGVIHAAPDAGALAVEFEEGPTVFDDLGFRAVSPYVAVDVGDYTILLREQDGDGTVAVATDITFDPGTVYDAVAIGRADEAALALLVLTAPAEVREGAVATPAAAAGETAGVAPTVVPAATPTTAEDTAPLAETVVAAEPGEKGTPEP